MILEVIFYPSIFLEEDFNAILTRLKRLGQSKEAVPFYFLAIKEYMKSNLKETARQINNILILFYSMGNLQLASQIARPNTAALSSMQSGLQRK